MLDFIVGLFCFVNFIASVLGIYGTYKADVSSKFTDVEGADEYMLKAANDIVNKISSYVMMLVALTSTAVWGFLFYLVVAGARLAIR